MKDILSDPKTRNINSTVFPTTKPWYRRAHAAAHDDHSVDLTGIIKPSFRC